jgi:hypothetical protein
VCHGKHEPDSVLLCDTDGCDGECHMACCNPPLTAVPDGLWFCSRCQSEEGFATRIHVKKVPQQKKKNLIKQRPAPAVTARTVTARAVTAAGVAAAVSVTATATVVSATVTGVSKNSRGRKRKGDTLSSTAVTASTTLPKTVANGTSSSSASTAVAAVPIRLRISHNNGTATGTTTGVSSKSVPEVRAHSARIRACNMNNLNNNHNSSNGSSSSRSVGSRKRSTHRYGTTSNSKTVDNSRISHVLETGGHFNKRPKRAPVCDTDTGNSSSSSSSAANGNGYSNHNGSSNGKFSVAYV